MERRTKTSLLDLVRRPIPAKPWDQGENIPWHEPGFSSRMLQEHLSQGHDAASRRTGLIDAHVEWIDGFLLRGRPGRLLDLACGPGLYTSRLARRGHRCLGIDYSPASIAYAEDLAAKEALDCEYECEDIRQAEYHSGFDLAMLIFGEFNTFRPSDARAIVQKAQDALVEGGLLLLEPHTFGAVRARGSGTRWYSAARGFFSEQPHLCLEEHFWDEATRTSTVRYFIVDAATGDVTRHAAAYQAYTDDEYAEMLLDVGFAAVELFPSLTGAADESQADLSAVVARK